MEKKEEVRQWVDEVISNAQNQDYTGKIKLELDFSLGGVTHCDIGFKGKPLEIRKNI